MNIIRGITILTLLSILASCSLTQPKDGLTGIKVDDQKIRVEMVNTPELMSKGLSDRADLPTNQGMLFVHQEYSQPGYWMKGMQFPIDIIWIKDDTIIDITKKIPPSDSSGRLPTYFPKNEVNYVLEVNAGWCDDNGIGVGDIVEF